MKRSALFFQTISSSLNYYEPDYVRVTCYIPKFLEFYAANFESMQRSFCKNFLKFANFLNCPKLDKSLHWILNKRHIERCACAHLST